MEEPEWKTRLREQFEETLASLEEPPSSFLEATGTTSDPSEEETGDEVAPDIYAFYECLSVLRHEVRQANRRTAEAFSQFGESMASFDAELKRWRQDGVGEGRSTTDSAPSTPRALLLPLVEMADRIERLRRSMESAPSAKAGWMARRALVPWQTAWEDRLAAVRLLTNQAQSLLQAAGLKPIPAQGQAFDPATMTAVAREESSTVGDLVVVEEITRGYVSGENVIRLAEVRVGRAPS